MLKAAINDGAPTVLAAVTRPSGSVGLELVNTKTGAHRIQVGAGRAAPAWTASAILLVCSRADSTYRQSSSVAPAPAQNNVLVDDADRCSD